MSPNPSSGLRDATIFVRAMLTNQLARYAPSAYLAWAKNTGRGVEEEAPEDVASYFLECFADYRATVDRVGLSLERLLRANEVLEYGPGDVPAVALIMYAHGAKRVVCADRFPLVNISDKNARILELIVDRLESPQRERAQAAFQIKGRPSSGFRKEAIAYRVTRDGLVAERDRYGLIYSRAVLEHVNDLSGTFHDMRDALLPDGIAVHQVDLRSHGLHRDTPLDFLCWSESAWALMHSHKGYANRWRVDAYRRHIVNCGLEELLVEPIERADLVSVEAIQDRLPTLFQGVSDDELSWLTFWMILRKRAAKASEQT